MKTINGVLIFWSEIKIGSGGCELFVVGLGFGGVGGQEMDTRLTLPSHQTDGGSAGFSFFNQR